MAADIGPAGVLPEDDYFRGVRLLAAEQLGRGELWDQGQMFLDVYFRDGPVPAIFRPAMSCSNVSVRSNSGATDILATVIAPSINNRS